MSTIPRISMLLCVVAASLAACSSQQDELTDWMTQEKNSARPMVQPLSAPQKFNPEKYSVADAVEPFSTQKLTVALKRDSSKASALVASEMNRRREPLESFPMDSMSMVGSVLRKQVRYALLKVDNLLYQVKVGDYLGQNYGKIMKITETDISLREIVQDAAGEWIERPAALQLQEGAQ
jgi:type IV pilus assembly protein PilP